MLLGLSRAFCLLVLFEFEIAWSKLFTRFSGFPSVIPRCLFASRDCFVLCDIRPASYSAMDAMIWSTNRLASGKSQNFISTSLSRSLDVKATFLDNRSSLATISVDPVFLHSAKASVNLGRSVFLPDSVSTNSAIGFSWPRYLPMISLCASIPSPEISCFFVDCLR